MPEKAKPEPIALLDLKAQTGLIEKKLRANMDAVLAHGRFIMGPEVGRLEERLAELAGTRHCVSCSSGTDALLLSLLALGAGKGDAVLTTPFTFAATAEVIALAGATPIFVDIDPATMNLDPQRLPQARDRAARAGLNPRGVLTVDLFGLPADYERINRFAAANDLFVLQDAAQSFGAVYRGGRSCSQGEMGATSFFPAKPLGCFGDGGAVFTDDDELAGLARSLRVHGQGAGKYDNVRVGLNARLDTLQAAVLLAKLDIFEQELAQRRSLARAYRERLGGIEGLELPAEPEGSAPAWAQFTIRSEQRDRIRQELAREDIPSAIYYPKPLHLQPAFAGFGFGPGDLPASERAARTVLSLPLHPYLRIEQIERVCRVVKKAMS